MNGTCKGYDIGTIHKCFHSGFVCVNFIGPSYVIWKFKEEMYTSWYGVSGIKWLYTARTFMSNTVGSINISPVNDLSVGFVHIKEH